MNNYIYFFEHDVTKVHRKNHIFSYFRYTLYTKRDCSFYLNKRWTLLFYKFVHKYYLVIKYFWLVIIKY